MSFRILAGIAVFLAALDQAWAKSESACLDYEPATVTLTGIVISRTFPGPPNYESIRDGDTPENYWLLALPRAICVNQKPGDLTNVAKKKIRRVQLVFSSETDYEKYRRLLGKRVVATGTLYGSHTGHHKTPVLLTVSSVRKAKMHPRPASQRR